VRFQVFHSQYFHLPEIVDSDDFRQVFIYTAKADTHELPAFAEQICNPRDGTKCLVKWLNSNSTVDENDLENTLLLSQVLIILVTPLLISEIRDIGLPLPIRIMQENKRPYFPVSNFSPLLEEYCKRDQPIHSLGMDDPDFSTKLKEQLSRYVLDKKFVNEIKEKAFDEQIFMSYRKNDAKTAQSLMTKIHDLKDFEAVSVWYDRFLTIGEEFNDKILEEIAKSAAFAMTITQNITTKHADGSENYVAKKEYPYAVETMRPIVPIKAGDGDYSTLSQVFEGIDAPISLEEAERCFRSTMPNLPKDSTYTTERLYYLGRAYLAGYFFEQNQSRAVRLFERAANKIDKYSLESSEQLAKLYEDGGLVDGINYDEALKWRRRSVEICETVFGKEHSDTATT